MNSKYPNTTGYYVYVHITPDEMFYIGMSQQQPRVRWIPSKYNGCSLEQHIKQFGWKNICHVILKDELTKEQAEQLEDLLIQEATRQGFCINQRRSGGYERDNPNKYKREYRKNNPDYVERQHKLNKEYQREYQQTEKYKEHRREYRERSEVKERRREYDRQRYLNKKALQQ